MRRRAGLAVGLLAVLLPALAARGQEVRPPDPKVFEEAWKLFKDNFYDRSMHGVDWEAARLRHQPKARAARSQEEVHEAIVGLLAELRSSHASVIEPDVYIKHYDHEAKSRLAPTFGVRVARLEEGWFVHEAIAGGPAAAAGVLRGDRLVTVNGRPPEEAGLRPLPWDSGLAALRPISRFYVLPTQKAGDRLRLELERFKRPKGMFQLTLESMDWNELEACRVSRRVVERHGLKVGYIRLYHLLSEEPVDMLMELIRQNGDADGIVIDLRGQGGLPSAVDRILEAFDPHTRGGPVWGRPAVALIDADTRSAKEVLAFFWRKQGIGTLVGQTTSGAVLGARFVQLGEHGAQLLIPILDMRTSTGGVNIEGKGVAPDVVVEPKLPWAQGADPILEKGLDVAFDQAMARRRKGQPAGWY